MNENKLNEMLKQAAGNFRGMIDANSVVGEPIRVCDGTVIVPISKVTFGFGGGGSEFDAKKPDDTNFGGGMGGGASVKAEAFLVINNDNVRLIPMDGSSGTLSKLVDLMPGMIDKVNAFVSGRKDKKSAKTGDAEPPVDID